MTSWNADSGAGLHAELIGRELIKKGHELKIFSFLKSDFHGRNFLREDEPFVVRCFGTPKTDFLDPRPIIKEPMDIFIVEDLGMLPKDKLSKLFPLIKKRAKTVNIIHDNKLSSDSSFYQFPWDKVIVFDKRYRDIFKNVYQKEKPQIIPYPCGYWKKGNQEKNRIKLKLPIDKKVIFIFGWWSKSFIPYLPILNEISKKYPLHLLIISKDTEVKQDYLKIENENLKIDFREQIVAPENLYSYLYASDTLIFGDKKTEGIVVCSTALISLGAGTPIIAPLSNFFETFNKEILKYKNPKELKNNIIEVFEKKEKCKEVNKAAKEFVDKNNPEAITERYIELFQSLL